MVGGRLFFYVVVIDRQDKHTREGSRRGGEWRAMSGHANNKAVSARGLEEGYRTGGGASASSSRKDGEEIASQCQAGREQSTLRRTAPPSHHSHTPDIMSASQKHDQLTAAYRHAFLVAESQAVRGGGSYTRGVVQGRAVGRGPVVMSSLSSD